MPAVTVLTKAKPSTVLITPTEPTVSSGSNRKLARHQDNTYKNNAIGYEGEMGSSIVSKQSDATLQASETQVHRSVEDEVLGRESQEHASTSVAGSGSQSPFFSAERTNAALARDFQSNSQLPTASPVTDMHVVNAVPVGQGCDRRTKLLVGVFVIMVVLGVILLAVFIPRSKSSSRAIPPEFSVPTSNPSSAPSLSRYTVMHELVAGISQEEVFGEESPQQKALMWALNDGAEVPLTETERLVQRYALAVFFFATGGENQYQWHDNCRFLTANHECDWKSFANSIGVTCNSEERIASISLSNNRLGGFIPTEVGLLTDLTSIDLHGGIQGGLGGDGHCLFYTTSSVTNEISGTIPSELGQLSRLAVLDLSKITLTGTVPSELYELPYLTDIRLDNTCVNTSGLLLP